MYQMLSIISHLLSFNVIIDGRKVILLFLLSTRNYFYFIQLTTDIPEFSDLGSFWDTRARGLGATTFRPVSMAAEENALCYSRDPYVDEDIVLHEFAHGLDLLGIRLRDRQTFNKLEMVYNHALQQRLWANTYARTTIEEYFVSYHHLYQKSTCFGNQNLFFVTKS